MIKHMLLGLGAASLLVVVTAMPVQAAGINLGKMPDLSVIVQVHTQSFGTLEWVWASPCRAEQPSCDDGAQGGTGGLALDSRFVFPTDAQWNASFTSLSILESAFTRIDQAAKDPINNPEGIVTICAAEYFTQDPRNNRCDLGDLRVGNIWKSPLSDPVWAANGLDSIAETFVLLKRENGSVPEPSSLLLLGAGLLGLAAWRWKQRA